MGTATPKTGQISFADLNTGILQAGSTAQLNMNTAGVRMGYGSTAQLSMSNLRGCYGVSATTYLAPGTKYVPAYYRTPEYTHSAAYDAHWYQQSPYTNDQLNFNYITNTGWDGVNVNRVAIDGTVKTYTSGPPASSSGGYVTPNWISNSAVTNFAAGVRFG